MTKYQMLTSMRRCGRRFKATTRLFVLRKKTLELKQQLNYSTLLKRSLDLKEQLSFTMKWLHLLLAVQTWLLTCKHWQFLPITSRAQDRVLGRSSKMLTRLALVIWAFYLMHYRGTHKPRRTDLPT